MFRRRHIREAMFMSVLRGGSGFGFSVSFPGTDLTVFFLPFFRKFKIRKGARFYKNA